MDERTDVSRSTSGRSSFPCRPRRQIPYLPNPINVELIASNRLSVRPRPSRDLADASGVDGAAGIRKEAEGETRAKIEQ